MRLLIVSSLLVLAAACDMSRAAGPAQTVIHVQVRDDIGKPVVRTAVIVTSSSAGRVQTRTGDDGAVDVRFENGGSFHVEALPKSGYVHNNGLARDVTVNMNERLVVDFYMARGGNIGDPIEPTGSGTP